MSTEWVQDPPSLSLLSPPLVRPPFPPDAEKIAVLLSENKKLRRLVVLLTDWNARSEEIITLRKELGVL